MSSSLLERLRATHEDIELLERAVVDELDAKRKSHKESLAQEHRIARLLDEARSLSANCLTTYDDTDREFALEVAALSGRASTTTKSGDAGNAFKEYYARLQSLREYHDKFPGVAPQPETAVVDAVMAEAQGAGVPRHAGVVAPGVAFAGEERLGRFVDLHGAHERYLNLVAASAGAMERCDYVDFLTEVTKLAEIPFAVKRSAAYQAFVRLLAEYLFDFLRKSQPLLDVEPIAESARAAFEREWEAGTCAGWFTSGAAGGAASGSAAGAGAGAGAGASAGSVYCGPCGKHFANENVYNAHLTGKKHKRNAAKFAAADAATAAAAAAAAAGAGAGSGASADGAGAAAAADGSGTDTTASGDAEMAATDGPSGSGGASAGASGSGNSGSATVLVLGLSSVLSGKYATALQNAAWTEAVALRLLAQLSDVMAATRKWVQKKHTMTREEIDAEIAADDAEGGGADGDDDDSSDSDSDDDLPYNPKNLPIGWDGKPMPYWLWKLHGLGVEYKCEICGNTSYWGRRQFDRHFQESLHAHNMRLLGIPNTKHFHDITKIEDALSLHKKLQGQIQEEVWTADTAEEFEDAAGNVVSKKTYDDLRREGLL